MLIEELEPIMNLSTPKPRKTTSPAINKAVQPAQRDRRAVIENDWVPAIQPSAMNHAKPIRFAGPLRPTWYIDGAKRIFSKVVRLKRQTV